MQLFIAKPTCTAPVPQPQRYLPPIFDALHEKLSAMVKIWWIFLWEKVEIIVEIVENWMKIWRKLEKEKSNFHEGG